MKVYQVTMSYFDGDHDHGHYRSPLFATRELAEDFLKRMTDEVAMANDFFLIVSHCYLLNEKTRWWTSSDEPDDPCISELPILDEPVKEIGKSSDYLIITYT